MVGTLVTILILCIIAFVVFFWNKDKRKVPPRVGEKPWEARREWVEPEKSLEEIIEEIDKIFKELRTEHSNLENAIEQMGFIKDFIREIKDYKKVIRTFKKED